MYFYQLSKAGGAERMLCALANALSSQGHRVHVVSWDPPGARSYYTLHEDVAWHRLGFKAGLSDKVRRTYALSQLLRREGVRLLIGFVMSGDKTVYAAAKLAGVKLVAAERNAPSMYRLRHTSLQRWQCFLLLRSVDNVVVQFADYANGYPAALQGRIQTIANPVAEAIRKASPAKPDSLGRFSLLAVSRLDEIQKRVGQLIDAFALIAARKTQWDLEIVGDGPDELALRNQITRLGLQERVRILPSTLSVFERYAASNLFATSSLWEGFPNSLAEAMAHGLPAVGFAGADGVAHLIEDGVTGWLATGKADPAALAEALDAGMSDAAERERRGLAAVRAMAEYEPEKQYAEWLRLIDDLLRDCKQTASA